MGVLIIAVILGEGAVVWSGIDVIFRPYGLCYKLVQITALSALAAGFH